MDRLDGEWRDWSFRGAKSWTDWSPLTGATLSSVDRVAGAYLVGVPEGNRPLRRLAGDDPHGILGIGESANLRNRLRCLEAVASGRRERGHMAGWRLGPYPTTGGVLVRLGLRVEDLVISWCRARPQSKAGALMLEARMLQRYIRLFGEQPPLNYGSNWRAEGSK